MATIGTLVVKITANTAGLLKADAAIRTFANKSARSLLSLKGAIAGLGLGLIARDIVKTGMEFEKTMARVGAVTGANTKQFDALTKAAKLMGETTEYTASQAADALAFLGMAGFEASQAIAALPGVLDLATAGNIELGEAADIASNALTAMRLPVEELGRVNDVMVQGIRSANVDMRMLAESFKYGAPIAAGMGVQIEELVGLIGALGNAGIQGSMAGTQLAFAMTQNAEVLSKLGEDTKNADGSMKTLTDTIRILEQRGATTSDVMELFGQRAGRGVAALLGQGTEAIDKLIKKMEESEGVSKEVADRMRNTLAGSFKTLQSALEGIKIEAFARQSESLKNMIDGITLTIRSNKDTITDWVVDGLKLAITAIVSLIETLAEFKTAWTVFRVEAKRGEIAVIEGALAFQKLLPAIQAAQAEVDRLSRLEAAFRQAGVSAAQLALIMNQKAKAEEVLAKLTKEHAEVVENLGSKVRVTGAEMFANTKTTAQLKKELEGLKGEWSKLDASETKAHKILSDLNKVLEGQGMKAGNAAEQMKLLAEQAAAVGDGSEKATEGLIKIQSKLGDVYAMMGQAPPIEILSPEEAKARAEEWKKEVKNQYDTAMSGIEKRYAATMRNIDIESKVAAEAFDKTLLGGFDKALTEMEKNQITWGKISENIFNNTTNALASSFYKMATEWDGTLEGMADIANNAFNMILNSFFQMAAQMMAQQIMLNVVAPAMGGIAQAVGGAGAQAGLAALPGIGGLFGGGAAAAGGAGLMTGAAGVGAGVGAGGGAIGVGLGAEAAGATTIMGGGAAAGGGLAAAATTALPIVAGAAAAYLIGNEIAGMVEASKRSGGSAQRERYQGVLEDIFGFENFNRRALGVFDKQGVAAENMQEQFQRFSLSVEQATAFASSMKDEMGLTQTSVEDMTSMLIAGFEEAGKSATEFALALEQQAMKVAFQIDSTFAKFQEFKKAQAMTEKVGYLETLKVQLIDVASQMDLTEEEYKRTVEYLKEIEDALAGDTDAYGRLTDAFGDMDSVVSVLNERLKIQREELEAANQLYSEQEDIVRDLQSELDNAVAARDRLIDSEIEESDALKSIKGALEGLAESRKKMETEKELESVKGVFESQIAGFKGVAGMEWKVEELKAQQKEQEEMVKLLAKFSEFLPQTNVAFENLEQAQRYIEESLLKSMEEEQAAMETQRQQEIADAEAKVSEARENLTAQQDILTAMENNIIDLQTAITGTEEGIADAISGGANLIQEAIETGADIFAERFAEEASNLTLRVEGGEGVQFSNKQ